jgi:hypothetical protein
MCQNHWADTPFSQDFSPGQKEEIIRDLLSINCSLILSPGLQPWAEGRDYQGSAVNQLQLDLKPRASALGKWKRLIGICCQSIAA